MQLSGAAVWWEEWQLRILVLASLGIQWLLLLAAPMRRFTIPVWFRTCIVAATPWRSTRWPATLFNRHGGNAASSRDDGWSSNSKASVVEVLWAPVLLIHLGGQRELAAYRIEDSGLWMRHAVTVVTIALYAFYKSWHRHSYGDRRLLASAILLFVIGVLSFTEKPWALRRTSRINRLAAVSSSMVQTTSKKKGASKWRYCFTELKMDKSDILHAPPGVDDTTDVVERSQQHILTDREKVLLILSDMSLLATDSHLKQEQRQRRSSEEAERDWLTLSPRAEMGSKRWLRIAFGLIYTRANVAIPGLPHILLVPFLHITAIALFAASSKRHHNAIDLKTTYVLLCLTAALDILAEFIRQLLFKLMSQRYAYARQSPSTTTSSALHRMAQPAGVLLKCAAHVSYKDGFFVCQRRNLYHILAGLIFSNLVEVNARGLDLTSYRSFAPGSRNWVLDENLRKACGEEVQDSLSGSFDRSVILWHIATDRRMKTDNRIDDINRKFLECTQAISDYMAHLLNLRPDMLMTGSRQHLFTQAMEEVELILKDIESQQQPHSLQMLKKDMLAEKITDKARAKVNPSIDDKHAPQYPLVHDACKLAEELFDKMDRITRCQVMYRTGYLHAKRLGEGGEFLSFVWLILSLKGAKTLADKLQMPEPEPKSEPSFPDQGEPTATVASTNDDGEDLSFLFAGNPSFFLLD
uniref:DUF4220 domain-containing protein n=1 Tax=Oryza glumipatula TaxID=40148 RepID=A0A0E0AGI6_9ORYZ